MPEDFKCPCGRLLEYQYDHCFTLKLRRKTDEAPIERVVLIGTLCFGNLSERLKGTAQGELAKLILRGTSSKGIILIYKSSGKNGLKQFQASKTWHRNLSHHCTELKEDYGALPFSLSTGGNKLKLVFNMQKMLTRVRLEQKYRVHFYVRCKQQQQSGAVAPALEFVRPKLSQIPGSLATQFKSNSQTLQPTLFDYFNQQS